MLVWINGAFGSGKTLIAHELARRLPDAQVSDPEILGFALHKMLPASARGDFQELPQWRTGVLATLRSAAADYDGHLIVPMTIVRDDYFDEIVGGLRTGGLDVRHYTLSATAETLHRRLRRRSAYLLGKALRRDETWAIQQIERCVNALADERYATHVETDHLTPNEIVELIANEAGLALVHPRLTPMLERLHRLEIGARHIRI